MGLHCDGSYPHAFRNYIRSEPRFQAELTSDAGGAQRLELAKPRPNSQLWLLHGLLVSPKAPAQAISDLSGVVFATVVALAV